ncbi:hypothetical protein [Streptomyces atratus]
MHLPAQAIEGNAVRRDIETAHNGGNGLNLVITQLHDHFPCSPFRRISRVIRRKFGAMV